MPANGHVTPAALDGYLHRSLIDHARHEIKTHLAICEMCWQLRNRHRWDAARTHPLYADLERFLSDDFRPYFDSSRALAAEWDAANPATPDEVAEFFRTSTSYLYNLTIWEASGNRPRYLDAALSNLRRLGIRTIADFGCGIGNDTIPLYQQGFTVTGYDFTSPSTAFLRWRSNGAIPVVEPNQIEQAPAPDALWLIDTLDHLEDVDDHLGTVLSIVDTVVTENLTIHHGHSRKQFHHRRPFEELHALFQRHGLTSREGVPGDVQFWRRPDDAYHAVT